MFAKLNFARDDLCSPPFHVLHRVEAFAEESRGSDYTEGLSCGAWLRLFFAELPLESGWLLSAVADYFV